jgi:hypothetical protein
MLSPAEIQSLAHELAKALAPLLQQGQESNDVLPDGTQMRAVLRDCTTFADAEKKLTLGGIKNGGKRRALIARHSPKLFDALMREPYTG